MKVWAYTLVRNEATLIPYWVRHYKQFCERVVVFDEQSDDGTRYLAFDEGAEVRPYHGTGHLDDVAFVQFAQQTYPEARGCADWVIWTDADEILWHRDIGVRLQALLDEGVTWPHVEGYGMLAQQPPRKDGQITEEIRAGIPVAVYSKVAIFIPELEVVWTAGKHDATMTGRVQRDDGSDPLKLLHYRWLGDRYFRERNERNYTRLDEANRNQLHGKETYPGYTGALSPEWYTGQLAAARDVI